MPSKNGNTASGSNATGRHFAAGVPVQPVARNSLPGRRVSRIASKDLPREGVPRAPPTARLRMLETLVRLMAIETTKNGDIHVKAIEEPDP